MKINLQNTIPKLVSPKFIPLGQRANRVELLRDSRYLRKLNYELKGPVRGVWGTLGWEDDSPFYLDGTLECSKTGNTEEGMYAAHEAHSLTQREINDLKMVNPHLSEAKGTVQERYLNFDKVDFNLPEVFNPLELPRLRLTLFLQPDEGALVYYQHSQKGNYSDEDALFEYVMYTRESEPDRDRLTYYFAVEPKHILVPVDEAANLYRESDEETGLSFIIKILTFKQKEAREQEIYSESLKTLNQHVLLRAEPGNVLYNLVGEKKYDLLLFDPLTAGGATAYPDPEDAGTLLGGRFVSLESAAQLDQHARTLLLIHGTFVNTAKSYHGLMLRKGTNGESFSFLQHLIDSGQFEQIIALDHPTISHDAGQNVEWLRNRLNHLGVSFSKPLNIVTSSRGALVAEYMASDKKCAPFFTIERILMFSAGNGCGYFRLGTKIARGLSIWKNTVSGPAAKLILAIAQLSAEWFLKQPGCVLMNEDQPVLGEILSKKPLNPALRYRCVISDWDKCLVADEKWLKRIGKTSLDVVIRIALGKQHDWVIGYDRQQLIPQGSQNAGNIQLHCIHGRYMDLDFVKDTDCNLISDPHYLIEQYFREDAVV